MTGGVAGDDVERAVALGKEVVVVAADLGGGVEVGGEIEVAKPR